MKKIISLLLLLIAFSIQEHANASESEILEIINYTDLDPNPVLIFEGGYHEAKIFPVLPLLERRNIINASVKNTEEFTYKKGPDIFNVPAGTDFIIRIMLSSLNEVPVGKMIRVPNDNLVFTKTSKQMAAFGDILNDFISKKDINKEKKNDIDLSSIPKIADWFTAFKSAK